MKNITIAALLMYLFAFSSCKKSSSPPSIVGKWAFSNITGTYTQNYSTTNGSTTTYSFNSAINTLTQTTTTIGSTTQHITTTQVTSEVWNFLDDGTYTINENYTMSPSPAVTSTSSGTWEYLSNTHANNSFVLTGSGSYIISTLGNSGLYTFQTVNNTLVLSMVDAQTNNLGATSSTNLTITFTKQ